MAHGLTRRTLMGTGLALAAAPLARAAAAADPAAGEDAAILAAVHPQLRDHARTILAGQKAAPPLTRSALPALRRSGGAFDLPPRADIPWTVRRIPGGRGQPDVTIYIVNARPGARRPAVLHTHGGGFVMGSARSAVPHLQALARDLDIACVSVDYRLAPETGFAGSIDDNHAGLKWLHANAAALGVDPARIAVLGESAGGGHAALLAIAARDRGEVPVAFQCLIYPMLDDRTGSSRPAPPTAGRLMWTAAQNRFGWESFLGRPPGTAGVPARAVPARTADLAGLPPAFIGTGSIDLFHDEDVDYARRLNDAGVMTELIVVPGAFHGFDHPSFDAPVSRRFDAARLAALRDGLGIAA